MLRAHNALQGIALYKSYYYYNKFKVEYISQQHWQHAPAVEHKA